MNREEMLTKLAMDLAEWPNNDLEPLPNGFSHSSQILGDIQSDQGACGFTRTSWHQRRAELINRPSWDEAPDWATHLCQRGDGQWKWYPQKPHIDNVWATWVHDASLVGFQRNQLAAQGTIPAGHDWRETLEERPGCSSLEGANKPVSEVPHKEDDMNREEMLTNIVLDLGAWPDADFDAGQLFDATGGMVSGRSWKGLGFGREPDYIHARIGGKIEKFAKDEYLERRALMRRLDGITTSLGASDGFDESRADILGQNGNDGEHYMTLEEEEILAEEKHTCDRCGGAWWSPMNSECPCVSGKQLRYMDRCGEDWIDEFSRTATLDEFRGAMRFTLGKYIRRAGKKDELVSEIRKMRDYCDRWIAYEEGRS